MAIGPAPDQAQYRCPMHSKVHRLGPGKCPLCGMTLVEGIGMPATEDGHEP
jgi:hypothetical protein